MFYIKQVILAVFIVMKTYFLLGRNVDNGSFQFFRDVYKQKFTVKLFFKNWRPKKMERSDQNVSVQKYCDYYAFKFCSKKGKDGKSSSFF